MNLLEATEKACQEPTLIDALTYICIWESERAIRQALKKETDLEGKGWDTYFKRCIESVMHNYNPRINSDDVSTTPPVK